ncbi:MAG: hypothetical protein PHQ54_03315 [Candidatus Omnitrophica bacterium]|nr:hypothetical protein [Candidatus Omnitrophota bacterium]
MGLAYAFQTVPEEYAVQILSVGKAAAIALPECLVLMVNVMFALKTVQVGNAVQILSVGKAVEFARPIRTVRMEYV